MNTMQRKEPVINAKNQLLLNYMKPFLGNRFFDRGKWFLMQHLNPKPGKDSDWARIGYLEAKAKNGARIWCDMQHAADRFLYFTGEYEIGLTRFLERTINQNWHVVDVGANVGKYMIVAAPLAKTVHCFEPNPTTRKLLQKNIDLNQFQNVEVYPYALSDQSGTTLLFQSGEDIGGASLLGNEASTCDYEVTMATGDSVMSIVDGSPVYLKIDVEGFEEHVLRGFGQLLSQRCTVVQVEITADWLTDAGGSVESLFSYMSSLGYYPYIVKTKSLLRTQPYLLRLTEPMAKFQYDCIFLPFNELDDYWSWNVQQ